MRVLAIFGPTAVGKTGVAIAVAERLRERGEDPVAVSCDALQVYQGLEALTGAPTREQRARLEHRLVGITDLSTEFSVGHFAQLAHAEIDSLLRAGRLPLVVGGSGLYLRAALSELELQPPVDPEVRAQVEQELQERGSAKLHPQLPRVVGRTIDPRDAKRVSRAVELWRSGRLPHPTATQLWSAQHRHPTTLIGLTMERGALVTRIDARVEGMLAAGAREEAENACRAGASRTARAALGVEELLRDDVAAMKAAHRAYARRQMTWMRKLEGVRLIDRGDRADEALAEEVLEVLPGAGLHSSPPVVS